MTKRTTSIGALSRRERQVIDILFRRGETTAADVRASRGGSSGRGGAAGSGGGGSPGAHVAGRVRLERAKIARPK
jgi:hypothetical protein